MFSFLSNIVAIFVFLSKYRKRWLWLPALVLGIFLFWVFLTWNRIPTFNDNVEISPKCNTDSCSIAVSVKHPYFTFNHFGDDFFGFWTDYGTSAEGIYFNISQNSVANIERYDSIPYYDKNVESEVRKFFPNHELDSIESIFEFRVRKELFGNMNARKAHNKLFAAWEECKGFNITKRIAKYDNNICVDSLRVLAGMNKFSSSSISVGYHAKMYYTPMRLLRMEDISQFNYKLILNDKGSCVDRLEMDFGGPVEFKGLWPIPDDIEPSRIIYYSKDKISQIKNSGGIKMFCQSLESITIQNVRLFILTTLISVCFAYILKEICTFTLLCLKFLKKKWTSNRNIIEKRFEDATKTFQNRCKKIFKQR